MLCIFLNFSNVCFLRAGLALPGCSGLLKFCHSGLMSNVTVTLASALASSQVLHWTSETAPCHNDRIRCQSAVLKHNATSTTDNCHRNVMVKTIVMYTEMHLRRTSSFYITGIENGQSNWKQMTGGRQGEIKGYLQGHNLKQWKQFRDNDDTFQTFQEALKFWQSLNRKWIKDKS